MDTPRSNEPSHPHESTPSQRNHFNNRPPSRTDSTTGSINTDSDFLRQSEMNPEALWQRPYSDSLQIAHVDQFGKVTTFLEPPVDSQNYLNHESLNVANNNKFTAKIKKLIRDDECIDEDEAWRRAQDFVIQILEETKLSSQAYDDEEEWVKNYLID